MRRDPMPRRYRKYRAPLPDMSRYWADPNMQAWLRAHKYRKYRPYVLAGVLAWMLIRRFRALHQRERTAPPRRAPLPVR